MAQMTYDDFSTLSKSSEKTTGGNYTNQPSYFSLKEDGDTAIVRFNIDDIRNLIVHSCHTVTINGKRRKVECLRGPKDDTSKCPLCLGGYKPTYRIFIELIRYETGEDNSIVLKPEVWETSARFRETLKSYAMDYGDLRNMVFKVTRHGKRGDTSTSYSLIPANPQIYKPEIYPIDFSAFNNFSINKYMVLNKTFEELQYYIENGEFSTTSKPTTYTTTPTMPTNREIPVSKPMVEPVQPTVTKPTFNQETVTSTPISIRNQEVSNNTPSSNPRDNFRESLRSDSPIRETTSTTPRGSTPTPSPRRYTY